MSQSETTGNGGGNNGVVLIRQPHGGALRSGGMPGNGGGGRTNEFRKQMRKLVDDTETQEYLTKCLRGQHGARVFMSALQYSTDHGFGKAPQTLKLEGDRRQDSGEAMMARVLEAVPNMLAMVPGAREQVEQALRDADNVVEADFTVEAVDVEP